MLLLDYGPMRKSTKRAKLISPRERLLLFMENTKEYAIIVLDLQGKVEDWNVGARHLLGYSPKEVIGKNFAIFFTPEDQKNKRPEKELQRAQKEGRADDNNWLVRKDGSRFFASGLTTAIFDKLGNRMGFTKIIRDLTDKQELDQQKDDFLAIASHELLTPLTVANIHRQILKRHLEQNNDREGIKYFNEITAAMEQLNHLVRDLLNVTKIQATDTSNEKEIISLEKVVKNVVREIQKTNIAHKIIINGEAPNKILANKSQIEEVVTNLLTNAIKYSPKAKEVVVLLKQDKKTVEVAVQDYGIGIEKKSLSRVFDRFYRTPESRKEKLPGLGLGLYITKKIVENHKGQINVESIRGKGSIFSFTLPVKVDQNK